MINGAHIVIYTKDPDADRAFFRDVLKFSFVDAGHGWLIFAMPPLEVAFHDSERNEQHELYLMCDDITATLKDLKSKNVKVSDVNEQRWESAFTNQNIRVHSPSSRKQLHDQHEPAAGTDNRWE